MNIELIVVGKTDSTQIAQLIETYAKRISNYTRFGITTVPDVRNNRSMTFNQQKKCEGEAILRLLSESDYVVTLDERGRQMTSVDFAFWMQKRMNSGLKRLCFIMFAVALGNDILAPDCPRDIRRTALPCIHHSQQRTLSPRLTPARRTTQFHS